MAFKLSKHGGQPPDSPESLFRDLRGRRIPGLLAHQADVIRAYLKHEDSADVALQLPTGSGKTLIGLLIAEWRRRAKKERVVYLCPTNQLVNQVTTQANEQYGMSVFGFTGKKLAYDPEAKTAYENADAIAVTNYSSLFNTHPFFDSPQFIILDDAHSAENYISNFWSLKIDRFGDNTSLLFERLVQVLKPKLESGTFSRLTSEAEDNDAWESQWTDKLPSPHFSELHDNIRDLLDEHCEAEQPPSLRFTWSLLRDHLSGCHLYLSRSQILLRPLIPPTNSHLPFSNATQRIYMSATLGQSGDLERVTGRSPITRIPIPPGWDKQGIGRRFFVFPQMSLAEEQSLRVVEDAIEIGRRAFVIVPSDKDAERFATEFQTNPNITIFRAKEIEDSKADFVSTDLAVAIAANRYDGIDLKDDDCRVLAVDGLPRGANLQERFFMSRLSAGIVLAERIRTRIVQGFGRCTRSPTDYALVIVIGESLQGYLSRRENRQSLHPEIQAELEFGIEQSRKTTRDDIKGNIQSFLKQNKEWSRADEVIIGLRSQMKQTVETGASDLRKIVEFELDYQYAMWDHDYLSALESARSILTGLARPELRGYRALWLYLAGSAAWFASQKAANRPMQATAKTYFSAAMGAAPGVRWLGELTSLGNPSSNLSAAFSRPSESLIERLEERLEHLGTVHDRKYNRVEREILEGLKSAESTEFEEALLRLGQLIGYDAGKEEKSGSPDPWWQADDSLVFVFEAHSRKSEESTLSVTKARQAATHPNWIRSHLSLKSDAKIIPILATDKTIADSNALPHLNNVRYWSLGSLYDWAANAMATIREIRRTFPGPGDLSWRESAMEAYRNASLFPEDLDAALPIAAEAMKKGRN